MIERLARTCHRRRGTTLLVWLLVAIGITLLAGTLGDVVADGGSLDGTDSQAALDLFRAEFPGVTGEEATLVLHSTDGPVSADRTTVEVYLAQVAALDGVGSVGDPFSADTVSPDGATAYTTVRFSTEDVTEQQEAADEIVALGGHDAGWTVAHLGYWFQDVTVPSSELFGLLAAGLILLVAFGSVVAMGLPIVTAIVGITTGLAGVTLWSHVVQTPDFTVQVASMIGIGVGIDYALFIVTRFRQARAGGATDAEAVSEAYATAGRAVAFAGCTVVISLLGMLLMGLPFLYGLAIGTSSAVLVAVVAAVTLLPALLGYLGRHLDRLSVHRRGVVSGRETGWHRWSRMVQRHPGRFALGGLVVLLAAAAPVLSMRLATADAGNDAPGTITREAYDLLADGFGPGANGPLLVITPLSGDGDLARLDELAAAMRTTPGVVVVGEPTVSPSGGAAIITVVPASAPQDQATTDLVERLRIVEIPASGLDAHVGGQTAGDVDFADRMSARLPVFIGAVLALSFLLLLAVFRSVLVPLKAVVMNLLSIGGAYGVMVAVFQWGWLGWAFGVHSTAPIEPWAPMMLFAIVFGLSMDYEVFLLSSVRERYGVTRDNSDAVVEGLASTARVITAAAAIMVCVFGTFVIGDQRAIKLIGLGLAVAVLIDATIVRMVLVPATMELLGDRNWWMPRWLDRLVPSLQIERHGARAVAAEEEARELVGVGS